MNFISNTPRGRYAKHRAGGLGMWWNACMVPSDAWLIMASITEILVHDDIYVS